MLETISPPSEPVSRFSVLDNRVTRCRWCILRIGRARFFDGAREVTEPVLHGLLSDTICAECLEVERAKLERLTLARAA